MMTFNAWKETRQTMTPGDARLLFSWEPLATETSQVCRYHGGVFIETLLDGTPVFGGVAMEDHQMAEEAAFQWLRATQAA